MLIIVEGADGSGKTTLVKKLRAHLSDQQFWVMNSAKRYTTRKQYELFSNWLRSRDRSSIRLLFDRFPLISEWVYGYLLRNQTYFDLEETKSIYRPLQGSKLIASEIQSLDKNPIIVYCRPNWNILKQSVLKETQMEGVTTNLEEIQKRYDLLMAELSEHLQTYFIDPYQTSYEELFSLLRENSK